MAEGEAAVDSITNSLKSTYLMNMKRTKRTGMSYADDNKKKNNISTKGDISNQNDEGPESKEDPSKINQLCPRSQNSAELFSLSSPSDTNSSAKNIICTSMPATSINSR